MQGASPLASLGLNPGGTGAGGVSRAGGGVPSESPTRRKTDRTAFLLAVPAAKERGDRGRWNYPSHATAAFEMVLSPGAGRASAAGACLLCRLPTLLQFIFLPPIPPPALAERSSPAGKGETQSLFRRGLRPRHPGIKPLAALTEPAKQVPSGGELARRCRLPPPPPEERLAPTFFFPCLDRRGGL